MRLSDEPGQDNRPARSGNQHSRESKSSQRQPRSPRQGNGNNAMGGAFAAAFAKAKK
jgi:uncharacterized protein